MDNTQRFTGRVDSYAKARPAYAEELIDCLAGWACLDAESTVADIGAGTGIFTAQLVRTKACIVAVEPNDEMRAEAAVRFSHSPSVSVLNGTAEQTTLSNASVDLVTAAQAFHWFNGEAFRPECLRILRGRAKIVLAWNRRITNTPVNMACEQVFRELCPRFKGFSGGIAEDDSRIDSFFRGKQDVWRFPNDLVYGKERFVKRCLSGSYAPKPGEESYDEFVSATNDIFEQLSQNGLLTVPNETWAYVGELR